MRKLTILLFLLFCAFQAFGQVGATVLETEFELNRRYAMCRIPLSYDSSYAHIKGYYLLMLPPKYAVRRDTAYISIDSFYHMATATGQDIFISYRYEYIEGYLQPRTYKNLPSKNCLSANPRECITLEIDEIPSLWKTFSMTLSKEDYEKGKIDSVYTLVYDYHYVETPVQMIKTTEFNPSDFLDLQNIQIIYLQGENWSRFREVLCPTSCGSSVVKYVQFALRDKGYYVRIDGVLDEITRKAIVDFQKKNDLPLGRLDIETLTKLEYNKYREFYNGYYGREIPGGYQYIDSPRYNH